MLVNYGYGRTMEMMNGCPTLSDRTALENPTSLASVEVD